MITVNSWLFWFIVALAAPTALGVIFLFIVCLIFTIMWVIHIIKFTKQDIKNNDCPYEINPEEHK